MADTLRIQMMGDFVLYVNERQTEYVANRSRKGAALVQYLIVNRGRAVPNSRLLSVFWSDERVTNPDNALKTLISRMRVNLNEIFPGLGACIVADRGGYHWERMPNMEIDLYEIEEILDALSRGGQDAGERRALIHRLQTLYGGDLLSACELNEWALPSAASLHNRYVAAVLDYVGLMHAENDDEEIIRVCRAALDVDSINERFHMELMDALLHTDRSHEALLQYEELMRLQYHAPGMEPSKEVRAFYDRLVAAGGTIDASLASIRAELHASGSKKEAFVCDYEVFREIFDIQARNMRRLGSTLFLGVIMVTQAGDQPTDGMRQGRLVHSLMDILRVNLRKGDVIAQVSPTTVAVLLPMVNYKSGDIVMERMKNLFYAEHPSSSVLYQYRIAALDEEKEQR